MPGQRSRPTFCAPPGPSWPGPPGAGSGGRRAGRWALGTWPEAAGVRVRGRPARSVLRVLPAGRVDCVGPAGGWTCRGRGLGAQAEPPHASTPGHRWLSCRGPRRRDDDDDDDGGRGGVRTRSPATPPRAAQASPCHLGPSEPFGLAGPLEALGIASPLRPPAHALAWLLRFHSPRREWPGRPLSPAGTTSVRRGPSPPSLLRPPPPPPVVLLAGQADEPSRPPSRGARGGGAGRGGQHHDLAGCVFPRRRRADPMGTVVSGPDGSAQSDRRAREVEEGRGIRARPGPPRALEVTQRGGDVGAAGEETPAARQGRRHSLPVSPEAARSRTQPGQRPNPKQPEPSVPPSRLGLVSQAHRREGSTPPAGQQTAGLYGSREAGRQAGSALDRSAILTAGVGASPLAWLGRGANAGVLGRRGAWLAAVWVRKGRDTRGGPGGAPPAASPPPPPPARLPSLSHPHPQLPAAPLAVWGLFSRRDARLADEREAALVGTLCVARGRTLGRHRAAGASCGPRGSHSELLGDVPPSRAAAQPPIRPAGRGGRGRRRAGGVAGLPSRPPRARERPDGQSALQRRAAVGVGRRAPGAGRAGGRAGVPGDRPAQRSGRGEAGAPGGRSPWWPEPRGGRAELRPAGTSGQGLRRAAAAARGRQGEKAPERTLGRPRRAGPGRAALVARRALAVGDGVPAAGRWALGTWPEAAGVRVRGRPARSVLRVLPAGRVDCVGPAGGWTCRGRGLGAQAEPPHAGTPGHRWLACRWPRRRHDDDDDDDDSGRGGVHTRPPATPPRAAQASPCHLGPSEPFGLAGPLEALASPLPFAPPRTRSPPPSLPQPETRVAGATSVPRRDHQCAQRPRPPECARTPTAPAGGAPSWPG
ncbi:collagen alpha-1(I) chain-like [Neofelis nebulosa]|uniref:collagen alpha-1(I) chain-like n=1 Tax=Neofelis nebulosa TaxID=61452 RepID=UPI00272A405B|nr:collagen alpha-1(I) chain-like [Neofelis nebulosa]